ncbi:type II toxin-antitoxin system RelE/ParE family toxin [bacterium]|nr:type II toxin-antitoxin system RelE/ParE family toxin [bacterium]
MRRRLIVIAESESDLREARTWYERQRTGLGDLYLDYVEEAFELVALNPDLFPKVFENNRLVRVRRFPYIVVYRVDDDQITIVAVYHCSRDPRGWQNRN